MTTFSFGDIFLPISSLAVNSFGDISGSLLAGQALPVSNKASHIGKDRRFYQLLCGLQSSSIQLCFLSTKSH